MIVDDKAYKSMLDHFEKSQQGISPIFGNERCLFLTGDDHVRFGTFQDLGSTLQNGFYFSLDFQAEGDFEHFLFGTGSSSGTSLIVTYDNQPLNKVISLQLQDSSGKRLLAQVGYQNLRQKD